MFSYDRQALSELFDFFLAQWRAGKNIYILAGNHDRLNQHFVYHEGKKVADILNKQSDNTIHFITEPEIHTIESQKILFMPYNKLFLGNYRNTILTNASV
jgi:DNA repair exonuclease SbcCD nuclease subunit